jgi:hypothetical protein
MFREQWLTEVANQVEPVFKGFNLQPYRVTCGWPCRGGTGIRKRIVGQCFGIEASKGGVSELFISPTLDEPLEVAGTLCHEMAHIAAGVKAGHTGKFRVVCKHVGLTEGKPTSVMPGKFLEESLSKIIEKLGPYPHQRLVPTIRASNKPNNRVKLMCECGCFVVISRKWLDEAGPPTCGCGGTMTDEVEEGE